MSRGRTLKPAFAGTTLSCLTLLVLAGCARAPVKWGNVHYSQSRPGSPDLGRGALGADLPSVSGGVDPCLRSIRVAAGGEDLFRVWWTARNDSSAVLAMQHSIDNGRSWKPPVAVETRDRGRRGCDRPAPGIFYDPRRGYLHIVYFLEPPGGAGVFFAHSMNKGGMFHSPVPVVYGNAPATADVAANGDSVVVVFEDPNASAPGIGIVLSRSTGHIFEARGEVTPEDVPAIAPRVALDHQKITVWWEPGESSGGRRIDRAGSRVGIWK